MIVVPGYQGRGAFFSARARNADVIRVREIPIAVAEKDFNGAKAVTQVNALHEDERRDVGNTIAIEIARYDAEARGLVVSRTAGTEAISAGGVKVDSKKGAGGQHQAGNGSQRNSPNDSAHRSPRFSVPSYTHA